MRLEHAAEPTFARHETFQPRWAWMRKAHSAATADPRIFNRDDATLSLGVGKNMVRSIRFWAQAAKVLTVLPDPDRSRMTVAVPTVFGESVFGPGGWDPFCEDIGTRWLLHWMMLSPPSALPVWWIAFHEFTGVEFADAHLEAFVADAIEAVSLWDSPAASAIEKDIGVMIRTYAPTAHAGHRQGIDDLLDSPFRDLGLLRCVEPRERIYRFAQGEKPSLPPEIAAFAAFDFLARTDSTARTVTISRLATEPGGPGRAFRLTESALTSVLEAASERVDGLAITSAAGVGQLAFDDEPSALGTRVLQSFYGSTPQIFADGVTRVAGEQGSTPASHNLLVSVPASPQSGRRSKARLRGPAPTDPLDHLDWVQDRLDAGVVT